MPRQKKQHLKRRKDGRYCCKYHGIQFMGATEEEAFALRDEYKQQEKSGEFKRKNQNFYEYAMQWMQDYKSHLAQRAYNSMVSTLERFINTIGNKLLSAYTPSDISRFYQRYNGMSASEISKVQHTIQGVFKSAYNDEIIRKDPTERIKAPKGYKGSHRAITPEERALIHATQHRLRPAVMVMLYAGLRKGEVLAMDIDRDMNFVTRTITVRQAVRHEGNGQPSIVKPKTEAGIRTIPMLDIIYAELNGKHGLLCPSASGKYMSMSAWANAWRSYLYALGEQKNGCKRYKAKDGWEEVSIRTHDLRHSFCTMLYDAGVDLKSAMLWMGHADQQTTMSIYTHLTEQRRTEAEIALRNAEKRAFGMQNGMQNDLFHVEPLKNKVLPDQG